MEPTAEMSTLFSPHIFRKGQVRHDIDNDYCDVATYPEN